MERKFYFPSLTERGKPFLVVHKGPVFSLNYHLVDYCYNVTYTSRNGSLVLNPIKNLLCHFRVHLPYGNRVLLRLQMGDDKLMTTTVATTTTTSTTIKNDSAQSREDETLDKIKLSSFDVMMMTDSLNKSDNRGGGGGGDTLKLNHDDDDDDDDGDRDCDGLHVVVWDGSLTWNHCSKNGDPKRDIQVWSQKNIVTIKISARTPIINSESSGYPVVKFWYHAEPVLDIVGSCKFGEVLVKQFCVSVVHVRHTWDESEKYCEKRGGHLASVRDENSQNIIDNFLINK
ncbi:conserved hypothetical protein [Pediculus humanus corporis]|uniref:C-type lectin domain-containing protein n=1 Tax=Pediculus humanus subsp. corporis TaxID=121224 RepID=E0VVU5_PEDHC|nr:uncharacterized protein Phum_PHUM467750 [Pediculus humanus corporis]EEB17501.1 conserved hypothetical protein [Pediculus humanus corporis]